MKKSLLPLFMLAVILAGCPNGTPTGRVGSLILMFSTTELPAKTIVPPLDMDVASYDISGVGPGSAEFSQTGVTTATAVQNSLAVGAWSISVEAFNAAHVLIGSGSTAVAIEAGKTSTTTVVVTPLSGKGTLTVNISWTPSGLIAAPSVVASLTPVGGSAQSLSFTPGTDSMSYASGNTLDTGYYWLAVQLLDGGEPTWSALEAVRILKDQTTSASFPLTESIINTGSINMTIVPNLQNPIDIILSGQEPQLPGGVDMTVGATTSESGVSYQWYLNGQLLAGQTGSSITIGSALAKGNYRLDLGVTKGTVISSEHVQFSVLDPATEVVTTNASETGTQLDIYFYKGAAYATNILYAVWIEKMDGTFVQNLLVSHAPATNVYPASGWVARPQSVPYWAHKTCLLDPYAGPPRTHDSQGMYLSFPTSDGGPVPLDLDAVTSATKQFNLLLHSKRKNDGLTQFRVMLELNRSFDYNATYDSGTYWANGQPSIVYGATVQASTPGKLYPMSILGAGHVEGSDGALHPTDNCTTALQIAGPVFVLVK